jgi:predicted transcriptional regulator
MDNTTLIEENEQFIPEETRNLCALVEVILNKAKGKDLKFSFLKMNEKYFSELNNFFETSSTETLILIPIIANKILDKNNIDASKIMEWLNSGISSAPTIHSTLQTLIRKGLIKKRLSRWNKESSGYHLSDPIEKAILTGDKSIVITNREKSFEQFLEQFGILYQDMEDDNIYYEDFKTEVFNLWEENKDIPFLKWLSQFKLLVDDMIIFSSMLHFHFVLNTEEISVEAIINEFEKKHTARQKLKISLVEETNKLLISKLIKYSNQYFASLESMSLADTVFENISGEPIKKIQQKKLVLKRGELLMPDLIQEEILYYNADQEKQISSIQKLLQPEKYDFVRQELRENGMSTGFTVILFGAPGTGKTSSVKSIARSTNRPIYHVETESIRGKYVGESEKNLAEIFTEYQKCRKYTGIDPILLFNEADALLGSRIQAHSGSDRMENTMANILLEKLENFDGIFMATTNLVGNLDKAFERRILFKIALERPCKETQRKIIANSFKQIDQETIEKISNNFSLSGAEIGNIKKKMMIAKLADPDLDSSSCIYELCKQEFIMAKPGRNKIGFV